MYNTLAKFQITNVFPTKKGHITYIISTPPFMLEIINFPCTEYEFSQMFDTSFIDEKISLIPGLIK